MAPILQVKMLTKRYGGLTAVNDVSFDVAPNEILSVIGPNGAGKSTIFKLISSFVAPTRGEVTFNGEVISGLAPHAVARKEMDCGCAGIFNAPCALESYATVFEEEGVLDRLEGFASEHGPRFYGLPLNEGTVTLERVATPVPDRVAGLVPFHAGETLNWRFVEAAD